MYTIDASVDEPIMLIDRHIGYNEEDGHGIDGAAFARELMMLDGMGKKRIQIWINSPGGNVMDAYNIYNAMLRSTTKVDTYCVGIAASIAAVLFQAGRNRIMADYSYLMYHNPFGTENNAALNAFRDSIIKMICQRSGVDEEKCLGMMKRTTWVSATEAVELKLCDTIEGSADYNKKRMAAVAVENNATGFYKEAGSIFNQLFKTQNVMPDFSKIANKLDLNEAASENAILKEIDKIENRAKKAENELEQAKKDLAQKELEIGKLNGVVNQHKTEKEAAETAAKKVQADALVKDAVKLNLIKNDSDTVAAWTDKATKDFEGTKLLIDSIPINKVANKIPVATLGNGTQASQMEGGSPAARLMAGIQNKMKKK